MYNCDRSTGLSSIQEFIDAYRGAIDFFVFSVALAETSKHLTPEMFRREVAKMPTGVQVIATHIKVRYRRHTVRDLHALGLRCLDVGECEKEYEFCKTSYSRTAEDLVTSPSRRTAVPLNRSC
jgi:hypothetical protein